MIVDSVTTPATIGSGHASIRARFGTEPPLTRPRQLSDIKRQLADIFADALAVRPGDSIFPWNIGSNGGVAFSRICEAANRATFVPGASFPIAIPLSEKQLVYPGLTEAATLDLWTDRLLWNAIGKKSLGRGRSITHQTPHEDTELRSRLEATGVLAAVQVPTGVLANARPLTISTLDNGPSQDVVLAGAAPGERLASIVPEELTWRAGSRFVVEKALEAWLMENHDTDRGSAFRDALLEPGETIEWAGNYLPFGVAGANIDVVMMTRLPDGLERFRVIELKVGALSARGLSEASAQVTQYAVFIRRFLERWSGDDVPMDPVPTVISAHSRRPKSADVNELRYSISEGGDVAFA